MIASLFFEITFRALVFQSDCGGCDFEDLQNKRAAGFAISSATNGLMQHCRGMGIGVYKRNCCEGWTDSDERMNQFPLFRTVQF